MAEERLKNFLGAASLRGYGLENKPRALAAAGAVVRYVENTQCGRPVSIRALRTYELNDTLQMDASTLDHLDLVGKPGLAAGKQARTAAGYHRPDTDAHGRETPPALAGLSAPEGRGHSGTPG